MAVQAQYPSNVFLNRSVQETKPVGGEFIDQTHMLFNNGETNARKRGRETAFNNPFSMQPNMVSTGLRLASGDQHRPFQQQQEHHHQQCIRNISPQFCSSVKSPNLSDHLEAQIGQQRNEIELLIQTQAEQLRCTLAEKRERHYRALLGALEESAARKLREKELEAKMVASRHFELEARVAQLGAEAQGWHAKAKAQEATAAALQAQLQQAIMNGRWCAQQQQEDGGMGLECAGGAEDAESGYVDPDQVVEMGGGPGCSGCRRRPATVVLLPCRHLCLCTECDAVAESCPLCLSYRNNSIEISLS